MILIEHESPNLEIQLWKRSYVFPMTHSHQMGRLQKKEVQRLGHQGLFAKSEKRLMGSNCLWQVPGNFPWLLFLRRNLSIGKKGAPHTTILSFFSTRRATLCTVQFWVKISKICFGKGISVYKPRVVSVVIQEIWKKQ